MTADGYLYIDENCRDTFQKELDKAFGKDKWRLVGNKFCDCWDMSQFPEEVTVDVIDDETDKKLGEVTIMSEPYIVDDSSGRYIDVEPKSIRTKKLT